VLSAAAPTRSSPTPDRILALDARRGVAAIGIAGMTALALVHAVPLADNQMLRVKALAGLALRLFTRKPS